MSSALHLLVLAKSPEPGRVKTRLCPPLSPAEAAAVAAAALADTLEAVHGCGADRKILALDGRPGPWLPPGFEVIEQRGTGLAERTARSAPPRAPRPETRNGGSSLFRPGRTLFAGCACRVERARSRSVRPMY